MLVVLMILLGSFQTSPVANAALSGCPNTWPAPVVNQPSSNGMPVELANIKKERAFDVVISPLGTEYSLDGTSWVKAGDENSGWSNPMMYAFIGKQGRTGWKIEIQGCAGFVNRYYGFDLEKQKDPLEIKDPSTFFNDASNRQKFGGPTNFQEATKFIDSIEKCKSEIVNAGNTYYSAAGSRDIWKNGFPSTLPSCQYLQSKSEHLQLFFKDPSCSSFDNGAYRVINGAKCKAFLGFYYYPAFSLSIVNFISLSEFDLLGPVDQTAILQKSASDKEALQERTKPNSPYSILIQRYSNLARDITERILPKINSIKELRTRANYLRSAVIDSRDQITKIIYQQVPDAQIMGQLPQWQRQLEDFESQSRNLEATPSLTKSIVCARGSNSKIIKGVNPKCPVGYKVKS